MCKYVSPMYVVALKRILDGLISKLYLIIITSYYVYTYSPEIQMDSL